MLTTKARAVVALRQVEQRWETFSPSQQAECTDLVERLRVAMAREHSVASRQPIRVPLLARITA